MKDLRLSYLMELAIGEVGFVVLLTGKIGLYQATYPCT